MKFFLLVFIKIFIIFKIKIVDINYAIYENAQDRYKAISWTYLENLPQGENRSLYFDYVNDVRLKKVIQNFIIFNIWLKF